MTAKSGRPAVGPRVAVRLRPEMVEWIDGLASKSRQTRSDVIRTALELIIWRMK
jgi:Arc/MetJ-type ribon-helix-helix transcriptional regulator